ncbi:MAG: S-layer family protein, partial [Stigonema ocellatum SAG 48.90 = DSM 106950]|nr:S-layer family protein [Stigonema ocellatum SAG 48.90 = DSM 106950]
LVVQTQGKGDGGTINVLAKNSLRIQGQNVEGQGAALASSTQGNSTGTGNAGDVNVKVTGSIELRNVAITTKTLDAGGNAGNINITGNSLVLKTANIVGSTTNIGKGGEININVAGPLTVESASINTGTSGGTGDAGKINITAHSFQVEGAGISSSAGENSTGKAGDITIKVPGQLTIDKAAINTDTSGTGDAGKIDIDAGSIELGLGGSLNTNTNDKGKAGTINITANSFLLKEGATINSSTGTHSTGTAGDITLNVTGPLTIMNQQEGNPPINSNTSGTGDAGKINITANSFQVEGAGISSSARENSTGKAGDITVKVAGPLTIDKAAINTDTSGTGDAGKINIDAGSIELASGGGLNTNTNGKGKAGTINITANSFLLKEGGFINSSTGANSTGTAGDITLNVAGLLIIDKAPITTNTSGTGDAGKINITANSLQVEGATISSSAGENSTGKAGNITVKVAGPLTIDQTAINTNTSGTGDAGKIDIDAGSIVLGPGGGLNTNTDGKGDAGTINIKANSFQIESSTIKSSTGVNSTGKAGDITFNVAGQLTIDQAAIKTDTSGTGDAGKINITANSFQVESTDINSSTEVNSTGKAGEINIDAGSIEVGSGGGLNTNTNGKGDAGTINIKANSFLLKDGEINSITELNSTGNAGDITVNVAGQLRIESTISTETTGIRNAGQITTEAKGTGNAGQITVSAESLKINNGSINATSRSGKGGNIDLEIGNLLLLRHQGSISTTAGTAGAGGDGGNITINVPNGFIVAINSENSDITANAFTGRGGNITINRSGLYGISPRPQLTPLSDITAFSQRGINGKISINQPAFEQHLELAKLPKVFADISLLDRSCSAIASTVSEVDSNTQQSQFRRKSLPNRTYLCPKSPKP